LKELLKENTDPYFKSDVIHHFLDYAWNLFGKMFFLKEMFEFVALFYAALILNLHYYPNK